MPKIIRTSAWYQEDIRLLFSHRIHFFADGMWARLNYIYYNIITHFPPQKEKKTTIQKRYMMHDRLIALNICSTTQTAQLLKLNRNLLGRFVSEFSRHSASLLKPHQTEHSHPESVKENTPTVSKNENSAFTRWQYSADNRQSYGQWAKISWFFFLKEKIKAEIDWRWKINRPI